MGDNENKVCAETEKCLNLIPHLYGMVLKHARDQGRNVVRWEFVPSILGTCPVLDVYDIESRTLGFFPNTKSCRPFLPAMCCPIAVHT